MSVARFRVVGRLDRGGGYHEGTFYIDRAAGIAGVRPLRCRRAYELPLSTVADLLCHVCCLAIARKRAVEKWEKRNARKGGRR